MSLIIFYYSAAVDCQLADFLCEVGIGLTAQCFADGFSGYTEQPRQFCDLAMLHEYFCHKINYFRIFVAEVTFETSMQIYKQ